MSGTLENSEKLHIRALETVLSFGALVNSSLDIERVLDHTVNWVQQFMGASASAVCELDDSSGELIVRHTSGEKRGPASEIRLRAGEGIAGKVVRSGEPVMSPDVRQDERFDRKLDLLTGVETRSMICVPLTNRGKTIGAVQVINKRSGEPFTNADLELLTAASHQIAVAIENARLYQRLQHKFLLTEKELKRTQEQLIYSERLSAMGNLVQGVAHEIRNPLMTIGGFARRLKSRDIDEKSLSRYADIILEEAGRLEKLVQEVKEFAEVQTAKLSSNRIELVLDRILPKIRALARTNQVEFRLHLDKDIPPVEMDCYQIAKAVMNIAENGIEAMPSGGTLEIRVSREENNLCICILDTGRGISTEKLDSIYDPFVTSKTRGAGLGLTMVHQIIRNHNGEITLQSSEGSGTTVKIRIPFTFPVPKRKYL